MSVARTANKSCETSPVEPSFALIGMIFGSKIAGIHTLFAAFLGCLSVVLFSA